MAIRQRGSSIQWDRKINGERYRETFKTVTEARQWEDLVLLTMGQGDPYPTRKGPRDATPAPADTKKGSLSAVAEACFAAEWAGLKHEAAYRGNVNRLLAYFGHTVMAREIDADRIAGYVQHLIAKGNANGTINRRLACLSKVLRFGVDNKLIPDMPKIRRKREVGGRIRWLDDTEEAAVLNTLDRWGKADHVAAVTCLLDTGMRPSELYGLTKRDADLTTGMLTIWESKTNKPRSIPMTKRVRAIVEGRLKDTEGTHLFPYDNAWMRNAWDRVRDHLGFMNDPHFVPYICRHTCASRLAQRGVRLQVIKEWLGHGTMTMTLRYAHLSPSSLDEAAQALEQAA